MHMCAIVWGTGLTRSSNNDGLPGEAAHDVAYTSLKRCEQTMFSCSDICILQSESKAGLHEQRHLVLFLDKWPNVTGVGDGDSLEPG